VPVHPFIKIGAATMKRFPLSILSVALMAFFLGCATLSKNECLEADWFEIGRKDGSLGKPRALFQKHMDACTKHGISPNREAYYAGRDEGLRIYCSEENGFEQGRLGRKYQHVCPLDLEPEFLAGFYAGREIYEYKSKVASLEKQLRSIENQIEAKEKDLHSSKLSKKQRAIVRSEIKSLDVEYRDVVRQLISLAETKPFTD
jgi:hypothetical protein